MSNDVLVGGLPNVAELIRQREREEMDKALERARKTALQAYPVLGFGDCWFAVPSQSELGSVYIVSLNPYNGNPNTCTCPNPKPWCTHVGAARLYYDAAREADDSQRQKDAEAHIFDLQEHKRG